MAYQFDGTDDFASASFALPYSSLSIGCWVYWDANLTNGDRLLSYLTGLGWDTGSAWETVVDSTAGTWRTLAGPGPGGGSTAAARDAARPTAATWNHLGVTFDRTASAADIKHYVNGSLVSSTDLFTGTPAGNWTSGELSVMRGSATAAQFGAGRMGELVLAGGTIWTATEFAKLAAGQPGDAISGATHYWPLRDNWTAKLGGVNLTPGASGAAPSVVAHPPAVRSLRMVGGGHIRSLTGGGLAG